MISKKRKYCYNSETLSFVEARPARKQRFLKVILFCTSICILTLILYFVYNLYLDAPQNKLSQYMTKRYEYKLEQLRQQTDSLEYVLNNTLIVNDKKYREILEMDSLSGNIRIAGTGGHDLVSDSIELSDAEGLDALFLKILNLKNQIRVQTSSYNEILKEALGRNKKLSHFPGITPVKKNHEFFISSFFGSRSDPFSSDVGYHCGVDFVGEMNTKIYATADGIVNSSGLSFGGYGNEIIVNHGYGYSTRYAHLNKILVTEGQTVKRGQIIGYMGSTGRSTGTHLHYEVHYYSRPVNPLYFFADDLTPAEFEELCSIQWKKTGEKR